MVPKLCHCLHSENEMVSLGDTVIRGGGPDQLNPKCQDLSKSAFSGADVQTNSTQNAKICPNLHFQRVEGGGGPDQLNQSAKICPNLHLQGVGWVRVVQTTIPEILEGGHSRNFEPKILATGMCSASEIVSHTKHVWGLINSKAQLLFKGSQCTSYSWYNYKPFVKDLEALVK